LDLSKSYEYFKPEKNKERIHIMGCGSVGSTIAENLVRSGVTNLALWDFDKVEKKNLANQMFRYADIGKPKVDALFEILKEINPDIVDNIDIYPEGWTGQQLSGYIFLCVDNIDTRRQIVEKHFDNPYVVAMFDFRTRLEDAQHYAADWSDRKSKEDFLKSMAFTHDEASEATPVSACNVTLAVCPTIRTVCAYGISNFMNFWNGKPLRKVVLVDAFSFALDAF
jgi:sulfur carrier protein ThiS adenylyltransferase